MNHLSVHGEPVVVVIGLHVVGTVPGLSVISGKPCFIDQPCLVPYANQREQFSGLQDDHIITAVLKIGGCGKGSAAVIRNISPALAGFINSAVQLEQTDRVVIRQYGRVSFGKCVSVPLIGKGGQCYTGRTVEESRIAPTVEGCFKSADFFSVAKQNRVFPVCTECQRYPSERQPFAAVNPVQGGQALSEPEASRIEIVSGNYAAAIGRKISDRQAEQPRGICPDIHSCLRNGIP